MENFGGKSENLKYWLKLNIDAKIKQFEMKRILLTIELSSIEGELNRKMDAIVSIKNNRVI